MPGSRRRPLPSFRGWATTLFTCGRWGWSGLTTATWVQVAAADSRVVLTFDLDFGEILALGVLDKPSVVTFRLSDERPDSVNRHLLAVLAERTADLEAGALILVEDTRYRVRRLPIGHARS